MDISFAFRKIQKSIAGFSILAVLASLVSFTTIASAEDFDDVPSSHYAANAVDESSDEGWMTGYDNGDFGVDDYLTRGQAAKILVLGALGEDAVDEDYDAGFTDVSSSYSLENYVNTAELYGFVSGRTDADGDLTGEYDPDAYMNRAEFAKVAVEAFGLANVEESLDEFPDVDEGTWYEKSPTWYVSTAWAWSVINGYDNGNFYPAYSVTRGQAAIIVNNAQDPEWRVNTDPTDPTDPVASGSLWVEVSDESPNSTTIPSNATSVTLASWDFTAGDDAILDSLIVHQYGITSLSSTHQVYLYEGNTRLTSGTSVNSSSHEATFNNVNLAIDSGDTVTLSVRMDMGDYSATGEVGMEIVNASKVDAGEGEVDGDFPAQGDKHTISTTDAGTVTIEKNGSVDNAQVGEDGATIGKFKLSTATEAGGVEEIGLYLSGSVNASDVENFKLYVTGDDAEPLAEVDAVDDQDVIRFDISGDWDTDSTECENSDGYCISKSGSKSFYVTADFNTGRTDDTVSIYLDQSTDLFVRGNLYGSGMSVARTSYNGSTCTAASNTVCSFMTIEGGDITVSSSGPAAKDVATNGKDVSILDFTIVSVTDVVFDSFGISIDTTEAEATEGLLNGASTANFTDVKIWDNTNDETLYAGVDSTSFKTTSLSSTTAIDETTDASAAYYLFTDDFEMSAGEERNFSLTTDVANTTTLDGMTLTANLELGSTYPQLKDSNNKTLTNSSVLVPTSVITSKTMTVRTPSLALSLASTPTGSNTYVKGADDAVFTGIVFACGDSSDCTVTDLSLAGFYDEGNDGTYATASSGSTANLTGVVGSVWLVDADGEAITSSKSVNSTTWAVTFDSIDWTIPAGETVIAYVKGDISSSAPASDRVAFGISSAANVTVEDTDGNSFSATAGGSTTGLVNATSTSMSTYVFTSAGGSLAVAVAGSTAKENIVVAGSSDVELSKFEFTSTLEDFLVTDLSINARQSAATTAALGDYDNNVTGITISYENEDGDTVEDTGFLVNGTAIFSGLEFWVPADESADITVYADLNDISSGGTTATAAEFVDLSIAYNNFEAIAQGSGETYKADKIDDTVDAASDLDFGTITWTEPGALDVNLAVTTLADLGTSQTLKLDNASAATPANLPVGTLLCVNGATTCAANTTDNAILVVTSWSEGSAFTDGVDGDTVVATVINNADTAFANNDDVYYALPGSGFHTDTKQMVVYETKATVALSTSSPTSASSSTTEKPFYFTLSANANQRVKIRTAEINNANTNGADFNDSALAGTFTSADGTLATDGTVTSGGIGNGVYQRTTNAADTSDLSIVYTFGTAADLSAFSGMSYWYKSSNDGAANTVTTTLNDDDGTDQAGTTALLNAEWQFADIVFTPGTGNDNINAVSTITWFVTSAVSGGVLEIDRIVLYKEKLAIDVTANDTDIDAGTDNTDTGEAADILVGYLKEVGGSTVATGYLSTTAGNSDVASATWTFYPEAGVDSGIEVGAGQTTTYYLETDSVSLIDAESGVNDPVQYSFDLGTSTAGTVSAGDVWWYDDNVTVKWLGYVSSTTLYSNALNY